MIFISMCQQLHDKASKACINAKLVFIHMISVSIFANSQQTEILSEIVAKASDGQRYRCPAQVGCDQRRI